MTVHHHVLGSDFTALDDVNDQRVHAFRLDDCAGESDDLKGLELLVNTLHCLLNEAVSGIFSVNHGSQVWHSHELLESRHEEGVELAVNVGGKCILGCFNHLKYVVLC